MKSRFAALVFLVLLMTAGMAWAESPILVSHTLTGYSMGSDSVILNYTLNVKNSGESSVHNVTLTQVPLFIITRDRVTLNIGSLEPQGEMQIPFTFITPMLLNQSEISAQPLFWAGEYIDNNGNLIEFPARSVNGGAL